MLIGSGFGFRLDGGPGFERLISPGILFSKWYEFFQHGEDYFMTTPTEIIQAHQEKDTSTVVSLTAIIAKLTADRTDTATAIADLTALKDGIEAFKVPD